MSLLITPIDVFALVEDLFRLMTDLFAYVPTRPRPGVISGGGGSNSVATFGVNGARTTILLLAQILILLRLHREFQGPLLRDQADIGRLST